MLVFFSFSDEKISLSQCDFSGLSATVGHPERFNNWLCSVQEAHDFKHTFIQHQHRYSHLRKYFYLRRVTQTVFTGLSRHKSTGRLRFLHPVCMLSSGMARAIPPDFSLEARDCLTLFETFQKLVDTSSIIKDEIARLDPSRFFPPNNFLKQQDVITYEKALIKVLSKLIKEPNSHEDSSTLQAVVQHLTDPELKKTREDSDLLTMAPNETELHDNLIHLVSDLYVAGDMVGNVRF